MMRFSIGLQAFFISAAFLGAGCVTRISAFDGDGDGETVDVGGVTVGTPAVAVVSSSSGVTGDCGAFEDLGDCTADTTTPDLIDLASAKASVVDNWARCGDASIGTFDVGVRFADDGRAYRLYRGPNSGGSTEYLLYCGTDQSDGGHWSLENVPGTTERDFVLTVNWDDGTVATFDLELYQGRTRLGLFDTPEATTPEVFAPAGAAVGL